MNNGDTVKFSDLQLGDYFRDSVNHKYCKLPLFEMSPAEMHLLNLNLPSSPKFNTFDIQNHARTYVDPDESVVFIRHASQPDKPIADFEMSPEEATLDYQLELREEYLEAMEGFLQKTAEGYSEELDQLPVNYERRARPLRLNGYLTGADLVQDEVNEVTSNLQRIDEFTDLLWKSFFISLYAFLEAQLNSECRTRQLESKSIMVSLDDIHGAGINRAKTYFVKVLGSSFPFETDPQWQEVKLYGKLRNSLVHNEGRISDTELKRYVDGKDSLSHMPFLGGDCVVFGEKFCKQALSTVFLLLRSMLYYRQADEIY